MRFEMMLDMIIAACGVYVIYWAVQMRSTNKIPPMLVGRGFPINRAKDPNGFIKFTFPITLAVGVVLFVAGLAGAFGIFAMYPLAEILIQLLLIIVLIVYSIILMKAQKKYLVGIK